MMQVRLSTVLEDNNVTECICQDKPFRRLTLKKDYLA
jgi:hypothetical protein